MAQCFRWRRLYTIAGGSGFSPVTGLTSFLTVHTCLVDFTFTYIVAHSKAVLPAQYAVLSFRVMELVPRWAFPTNVTGYEI